MVATSFRLLSVELKRSKEKAGFVPLGYYIRALVGMWLDGSITITDEDLQKYNK